MMVLYDLCVTVTDTDDGQYGVEYSLQRRRPYPPVPRVGGAQVGFADVADTLQAAAERVPADAFAPAVLPALVDDLSWLWDRSRLEQFSKQVVRETAAGQVEVALAKLFQGQGTA